MVSGHGRHQLAARSDKDSKYGFWRGLSTAINKACQSTHKPLTRQSCAYWAKEGVIPPGRIPSLIKLSHGDTTYHDWRPDIYPEPEKVT